MDTNSFIVNMKTENVYESTAYDVEKRLDTLNCKIKRPLPTGKNKKGMGLMKD